MKEIVTGKYNTKAEEQSGYSHIQRMQSGTIKITEQIADKEYVRL